MEAFALLPVVASLEAAGRMVSTADSLLATNLTENDQNRKTKFNV